jgi:hypothetical protein
MGKSATVVGEALIARPLSLRPVAIGVDGEVTKRQKPRYRGSFRDLASMQAVTQVNAEPNGQARDLHEDGADQILRQAEDEWHVLDEEDQKTVLKIEDKGSGSTGCARPWG